MVDSDLSLEERNTDPKDGFGIEPMVSDEEVQRLILSLGQSRGEARFTEEDVAVLTDWAYDAKLSHGLYELVQSGLANVDVVDGEPVFTLSNVGKEEAS